MKLTQEKIDTVRKMVEAGCGRDQIKQVTGVAKSQISTIAVVLGLSRYRPQGTRIGRKKAVVPVPQKPKAE